MSKLYYAGIGARSTPYAILSDMYHIAKRLAKCGYILRSGGAIGADTAFEDGVDNVGGQKEIWIPWRGFNRRYEAVHLPTEWHTQIAETIHPIYDDLTDGSKQLIARNVGQILGHDASLFSSIVICYTPDGCESNNLRTASTGGTGTAITLASRYDVPVINLANPSSVDRVKQLFSQSNT